MLGMTEIDWSWIATPVPGPFFELEAEAVEFFIEEALGVRVACQDPAVFAVTVDG